MTWSGAFVFGDAWAAYRGPASENTPHAHAALQLVLGRGDKVRIALENGCEITGFAVLIRPAVVHSISSSGEIGLLYVEPQAPLALAMMDLVGSDDVEHLPDPLRRQLEPSAEPATWVELIQVVLPEPARTLDPRIAETMRWLARNPGANAIALAARRSGLSQSHLRALARAQLGFPLSTWLVWRKLERAAREMAEGASLAQAASAAGFADQAHCARTMRRMFGVTPGMAQQALS